jgi:dual-specificity kinase
MIGEGTFGRVLECWDRQTRTIVAVKVIRSVPKYRDAAMIEVCSSSPKLDFSA